MQVLKLMFHDFGGKFPSSEFCEQKMLGFTKKDGTANHFKEIWWVYNWERICSGIVPKSEIYP